jgi:hypothetical protein
MYDLVMESDPGEKKLDFVAVESALWEMSPEDRQLFTESTGYDPVGVLGMYPVFDVEFAARWMGVSPKYVYKLIENRVIYSESEGPLVGSKFSFGGMVTLSLFNLFRQIGLKPKEVNLLSRELMKRLDIEKLSDEELRGWPSGKPIAVVYGTEEDGYRVHLGNHSDSVSQIFAGVSRIVDIGGKPHRNTPGIVVLLDVADFFRSRGILMGEYIRRVRAKHLELTGRLKPVN